MEWHERARVREVHVETVRNGSRTWQVRWTWQGRGTRWVRIVRTEQRRTGWPEGVWREVRGMPQCRQGAQVISEVWSS